MVPLNTEISFLSAVDKRSAGRRGSSEKTESMPMVVDFLWTAYCSQSCNCNFYTSTVLQSMFSNLFGRWPVWCNYNTSPLACSNHEMWFLAAVAGWREGPLNSKGVELSPDWLCPSLKY
eukprot:1295959-Ditylum_brightwellii.AAC.1